jgi:hypothetical protein
MITVQRKDLEWARDQLIIVLEEDYINTNAEMHSSAIKRIVDRLDFVRKEMDGTL